jgi:transglutaminase-like putative cysteine protease
MIAKRPIGVAIVLFWCLMNVLLIKRQLWAPPPPLTLKSSERITHPLDEWWGVFYRGEKIGYASQSVRPKPAGYKLSSFSTLHLNLLGTNQSVTTRLESETNEEWIVEKFSFDLASKEVSFKARGMVTPGKLHLESESAGPRSKVELPLSHAPYLLATLKPYAATQQLEPGRPHHFSTFDPATLSQQITTVTIEGREQLRIGSKTEPAIRIRQQFKGISVTSWIDGSGRTLREESPAGLSLVQQSPEEARTIPASKAMPLDLITQSSIEPDRPISEPGLRQSLKLKLSGFELANFSLQSGRQKLSGDHLEIRRERVEPVSISSASPHDSTLRSYLQATPFVQSDHPEIRALARKIIGAEKEPLQVIIRIKDWVYREIAKQPTVSLPNALEVLRIRKGDCNEHTVLFNALARAAGIPAKTAVGVTYLRGAFYYHAWSEVWLGKWISLDSVLNQFPTDVTHIKFLEGEIDRQIDILQLIGKLKIEVIEAL